MKFLTNRNKNTKTLNNNNKQFYKKTILENHKIENKQKSINKQNQKDILLEEPSTNNEDNQNKENSQTYNITNTDNSSAFLIKNNIFLKHSITPIKSGKNKNAHFESAKK